MSLVCLSLIGYWIRIKLSRFEMLAFPQAAAVVVAVDVKAGKPFIFVRHLTVASIYIYKGIVASFLYCVRDLFVFLSSFLQRLRRGR